MKHIAENKYIQRVILCLTFVVILAGLLVLSARLVERKESMEKNGSYFAEAQDGHIDGLLIGSSHVINGINPAQIYEETGYTIYNLAGHGSTLPVSYWTLVNALDYCTPRVVFIDTYMLEKDYQYLDINVEGDDHDPDSAVDQLHEVMDCFPESANKRAAIRDLISNADTRREFSLDFIKYHSRWGSLSENDYEEMWETKSTSLMGAQLRYEVSDSVTQYPLLSYEDADPTESIGKQYLRRIIELCQGRGITPVIIQVPYEASEDHQRTANSAAAIAEGYGIPFVNLRYVENIINDYSDLQSQTHLSAYGSYKVTHYLAQNTLGDLGFVDHRGEAGYDAWEQCVADWHEEILSAASNPQNLTAALMILQFPDVTSRVYVREDAALQGDTILTQELEDLRRDVPGAVVESYRFAQTPLPDEDTYAEELADADLILYIYRQSDGSLLRRLVCKDDGFVIE